MFAQTRETSAWTKSSWLLMKPGQEKSAIEKQEP